MRLTVGSLPASVYWRRRAIVLAVPMLAIAVIGWTACSGSDKSGGKARAAAETRNISSGRTTAPPTTKPPQGQQTYGATSPQGSSGTQGQTNLASVPNGAGNDNVRITCGDNDIQVTAALPTLILKVDQDVDLTLKIKNVSSVACYRDLGATPQELYIQKSDGTRIYSSDDCNSDSKNGNDITQLAVNEERSYKVIWDGRATSTGCGSRQIPSAGEYQLFGRLDKKLSEVVKFTLT
jgi:hypothetical protein